MKKIKIIIPDNLSEKEEVAAIAQKLMQKALTGHGRQADRIRIGTQVDIKELTTQITVERTGPKPIQLVTCNVCNCDYQSDLYFPVNVNYGGRTKKIKVCSPKCQEDLISICGEGRAAIKVKDLKPVRFY